MQKAHIIVLTWNNENLLERCLKSINNVDYSDFTITVINNNSSDNTVSMIAEKFPNVSIINNNKNLKFGAGYNSGLKKMNIEDDDFMILLNDDTIVEKLLKGSRQNLYISAIPATFGTIAKKAVTEVGAPS